MVSSYLVHHGYSSTAESFAKATEQSLKEDMSSIKTRQSNNFNKTTKQMTLFQCDAI